MQKSYNPLSIYRPLANYSHAVVGTTRLLFISGQLGIMSDGSLPVRAVDQARRCFNNVNEILKDAGLDVSHVLRINAYVSSREYLSDYMRARDEWIIEMSDPPASTLMIVVGFAKPEMKVEVEVTAGFPDARSE